MHQKGYKRLSSRIDTLNKVLTNCIVYGSSDIDVDVKFAYGGVSFIIHKKAKIGSGCTIGQGVTIGMIFGESGSPNIEDNVYIGPGARILGDITIGHDSIIAPNAVVNKSTPPYSVIGGVPAKVITRINKESLEEKYYLYGVKHFYEEK